MGVRARRSVRRVTPSAASRLSARSRVPSRDRCPRPRLRGAGSGRLALGKRPTVGARRSPGAGPGRRMDERITSAMVVLASSGLWLRSLRGPRWRDPGAREAGLGGGRGPSGVPGGAPRDRPRVCGGGIPRPCFPGGPAVPEVSPRAAASAGSRVPLPVCALFPARRPPILSSPRAAHRLDVGWWPRLGPNPAPPCWGRRRRPLVGPVSASPGARLRDRVGGAPRGARWASRRVSGGRPVARVRGKRGCRGTGRDCGGGGGEPRGAPRAGRPLRVPRGAAFPLGGCRR